MPFTTPQFDLIASINALHHIQEPDALVHRCATFLRPGGRLAIVTYDPGRDDQSWYVYDDFTDTRDRDLGRFPREAEVMEWMERAGLGDLDCEVAETIERHYVGREVLDDHFLDKSSNSTLAGLSDAVYEAGLAALRRRIEQAESDGEALRFVVRLELLLLSGRKS